MELILTNQGLSLVQGIPWGPQKITDIQCQSRISQDPNNPRVLTTTNQNQKQKRHD